MILRRCHGLAVTQSSHPSTCLTFLVPGVTVLHEIARITRCQVQSVATRYLPRLDSKLLSLQLASASS
eukprot:6125663-Amphidinium_carterae.1